MKTRNPPTSSPPSVAEEIALLGRFARAASHDFGNLVLPGKDRLESLAEAAAPEDASSLRFVQLLIESLEDARFALDLIAAAGDPRGNDEPQALSLERWWSACGRLIRPLLPDGAALRCECPPDFPMLRLAPAGWTRAVLSLIVHQRRQAAADAVLRIEAFPDASAGHALIRIDGLTASPGGPTDAIGEALACLNAAGGQATIEPSPRPTALLCRVAFADVPGQSDPRRPRD